MQMKPLVLALLATTLAQPVQAGIADRYELTRLGLTGADYINTSNGYQNSGVSILNAAGQATGTSNRYNGSTDTGLSAWLYNGSTNQNIGLTGIEHTREDGYQISDVYLLNAAGQAAGYSYRYNGSFDMGQSAWLYNGTTTQNIGLTGSEHTRDYGYQNSAVTSINAAGQAVGYSSRYIGSTYTGFSAWLYNGTTTQNIGLTGTSYTSSAGYKHSEVYLLNDAGQAAGHSQRFNGSINTGLSAWLFNGTTTQIIGLTGAGYTDTSTGYQYNSVSALNAAGQAAGASVRYNGSTSNGQSAWLYNGSTTQNIGLTGTGYTNTSNGYQESVVSALNDAGQAAGNSLRYNGSNGTGISAWLYNGTSTQNIGLTGTGYTHTSTGSQSSWVSALNNTGQVAGFSLRYNGSASTGQSAWFYDDDQNQTYAFDFSQRSDGYGFSAISYLGDDGLALGQYEAFSGATSLGYRAFAWTVGDGFADLGSLVEGGLDADWSYLASAYRGNAQGQIIGTGMLAVGGGQGAYLLTATPVPEPETYALMLVGFGLVGLQLRRKRKVICKIADNG